MSKRAMIALYNDPEVKALGFRLLIMVHDELIGECPIENLDKVSQKLSYWMGEAGKPEVSIPMKCDVVSFNRWYEDEYSVMLKEELDQKIKSGMSRQEGLNYLYNTYSECTPDQINYMINMEE